MRFFTTLTLLFLVLVSIAAQQTVGLFFNDSTSFNGYTLFSPMTSRTTYLIDNCGELVHSWQSNYVPGGSVYLLENGDLLRTARIPSSFNVGGTGGRIERFDWDGNLLWAYNYSSSTYHQHHDIEPMPNGNVLVLAWERKSTAEAIAKGRNPDFLGSNGLWPEHIVELKPIGTDSAEIVWEWHLWDHLVQNFSPNAPNYGDPAENPRRLDINAGAIGSGPGGWADWIHANSIDYNPTLDQILISSRRLHEIFIIDHGTTIGEAAGSNGGKRGHGGDFLYRWGNPYNYGRAALEEKTLFGQHDAHWIPEGLPDAGKIMVFNNGVDRPDGFFSTIDIIEPPLLPDGNYALDDGLPWAPAGVAWSWQADPPESFYSSNISGAQRLPNGNTLICEGDNGIFFEIDPQGNIVWQYVNPVGNFGPVAQGTPPVQNSVFRATRYAPDYPAFVGRDLMPIGPIELNPLPYECSIFVSAAGERSFRTLEGVRLVANPVSSTLRLENTTGTEILYTVFSLEGRALLQYADASERVELDVSMLPAGIFLLQARNGNGMLMERFLHLQ